MKSSRENFFRKKIEAALALGKVVINSGPTTTLESPIDFNRSKLLNLPLSSDSAKMSFRYLAFDKNTETAESHIENISGFISGSFEWLGKDFSVEAARSVQAQASNTLQKHTITGTTLVTISCTHKYSRIFEPLILKPDGLVRAWNATYDSNIIDTRDLPSLQRIMDEPKTNSDKSLCLISGASYGSSFVAMVHHLKETSTTTLEKYKTVADKVQAQYQYGGFIANASGGFGVDNKFSESAKQLISADTNRVVCNITTMGVIPTIVSNKVTSAVHKYTDLSPSKELQLIAEMQNMNADVMDSISASSEAARTKQQMMSLQSSKVSSAVSALSEHDANENMVIDATSMMTALDDFIARAGDDSDVNIGVPIKYHLKTISKNDIIQNWLSFYFPTSINEAGSIDDSAMDNDAE